MSLDYKFKVRLKYNQIIITMNIINSKDALIVDKFGLKLRAVIVWFVEEGVLLKIKYVEDLKII